MAGMLLLEEVRSPGFGVVRWGGNKPWNGTRENRKFYLGKCICEMKGLVISSNGLVIPSLKHLSHYFQKFLGNSN